MDLIKKHVDTIIVLGGILGSVLWMNGQFNKIEKDVAIIKTILFMKGIIPSELMVKHNDKIEKSEA